MEVSGAPSYRWMILLLATLVQVGVSILQQAPAALGPVLTRDLDLSRAQVGLLSSAIWGGMLLAMLPVGLLIDRHGERRLIIAGVTAMALLALWATRFDAFVWLLVLFLLASLGASTSAPGGSKAIAAWFPRSRRGGAMGVRQTGVTIGGLLAAFLLPPVAVRFGWEVALGLAAGVALVAVFCFALFYRELPADAGEGADGGTPAPRVPVRSMVRDPGFLAATGYAFVFMGVQGSSASYVALSLHEEVGLSVVAAGAFLAVFQMGGIAGRIGWGVVSDRIGRRGPVMVLVGLVAMGSCLAMASAREDTLIPFVAVFAFLLGLSAMGWNGVYLTLLSESVPMHAAATAMGASLTIAFVGMFLASPLFGLVADLTGSYGASWLGLAGWTVVGVVLGLLAREPREEPPGGRETVTGRDNAVPGSTRTPVRDSARAWVVVGAAFAALFVAFGVAFSFGAFFGPISAEFGAGRAAASVVFSLTSFLFFSLGAISGPAADRFGPRPLLLVGAVAFGTGLAATAVAERLWVAYLTYGVGVGVGVGCVYVPIIAAVGGWFVRRRALAVGVAVSGIGLGTLVAAPLAARLIDAHGWRTVYVGFAAVGSAVLLVSALVISAPPVGTAAGASRQTGAAIRTPAYRWLYLANLLLCLVLFVPFVHLPASAEDAGVGPTAAAGLVGVVGASSIVGRLVLGGVADSAGPLRAYRISFLLIGASFALWWIGDGLLPLAAFAAMLGVGYGGFVALSPVVLANFFGVERLGGLLGILLTANAVGSALGPPIVGFAVDATGSYTPAIAALTLLGLAAYTALLPLGRHVDVMARANHD